jgi:hypothetical protein
MNGKLDLPAWIDDWAALRSIASKLSLPPAGGQTPNAQTVLSEAVLSGTIQARERRGENIWVLLSPSEWAKQAVDGVLYLRGYQISRADLADFLIPPDRREGAKPGPKFNYDWEGCIIFMAGHMHVHGIPKVQAEFAAIVEGWFVDTIGKAPSMSEINKRVSLLYKEIARRDAE